MTRLLVVYFGGSRWEVQVFDRAGFEAKCLRVVAACTTQNAAHAAQRLLEGA